MDHMGSRIRQMREQRGLTLETVSKTLGISPSALSQIESGATKNLRLKNFLRLCVYFDSDPYWVVFGKAKPAGRGLARVLDLE